MSLILKGIDLPKEGSLVIAIQKYGNIYIQQKSEDGRNIFVDQKDYHQAIQIPKGARLIDANRTIARMQDIMCMTGYQSRAMGVIEFAPTILEDEEEEVPFKEVVKDYISETYGDINNL